MSRVIDTPRLSLVAATPAALRADIAGFGLADVLNADIGEWPPDAEYDAAAIQYTLNMQERDPRAREWGARYFVLKGARRTLIGVGGYTGPVKDGQVEIGYAIVPSQRRFGYASEATAALVRYAFAASDVVRVIAHTLPHLAPSIGVLRKCGFNFVGPGAEPGVVRYAIERDC
jgi:RimJ/RimL family protein N-acetyltransferase